VSKTLLQQVEAFFVFLQPAARQEIQGHGHRRSEESDPIPACRNGSASPEVEEGAEIETLKVRPNGVAPCKEAIIFLPRYEELVVMPTTRGFAKNPPTAPFGHGSALARHLSEP